MRLLSGRMTPPRRDNGHAAASKTPLLLWLGTDLGARTPSSCCPLDILLVAFSSLALLR